MARAHFSKPKSHASPQINLTPLIDVLFVILILFMLIAPLLQVDSIDLPKAGDHAASSNNTQNSISLKVDAKNHIYLNSKAISLQNLQKRLLAKYEENPTSTPQLFHDKAAPFGTYQSIKNAVENAGFARLDVILQPTP